MHNSILNICSIFNHHCPLCDSPSKGGSGPCAECLKELPYHHQGCDICALPGVTGICANCAKQRPSFSRVYAGFTYRFPLPQIVHKVKKGADPEALHWLAKTLTARLGAQLPEDAALMAVPMHPIDELIRGFNQSQILAESIARQLNRPAPLSILRKSRRTEHQAHLNRAQRRANLAHCFEIEREPPKRLILVDDVVTTGTTVERISDLLLKSGADEVFICTLCRTPD